MKEFLNVLRRFVPPYKKYLVLSVIFNILSAILNIFSFAALIPILQILFQTSDAETATSLMAWDWGNIQTVLMNNMNYYVNGLIAEWGQTTTLLFIGLFLAVPVPISFLPPPSSPSEQVWYVTSAIRCIKRSPLCPSASSRRNAKATSSPV